MAALRYFNGSSWITVPNGNKLKYWNGANWLTASAARYWNGSAWVLFWAQSSPITVSFYPSMATHIRRTGASPEYDALLTSPNNAAAGLALGRYGGDHPYHFTSLLQFRGNSREGVGSLTDLMLTRPVVKSAKIRLVRAYGGLSSAAGLIRFGTWTQAFAETLPATTLDGTYHDWNPQAAYDIYGWAHGQAREFGLHGQQIQDLRNGQSLMFSEVTGGHNDPGGTTAAYGAIWGMNTGDGNLLPILTVTLDAG